MRQMNKLASIVPTGVKFANYLGHICHTAGSCYVIQLYAERIARKCYMIIKYYIIKMKNYVR